MDVWMDEWMYVIRWCEVRHGVSIQKNLKASTGRHLQEGI